MGGREGGKVVRLGLRVKMWAGGINFSYKSNGERM